MGIKEREIKKILAGNVCFEGGMIVARESNWMVGTQGIPNGWGSMMVAGLYKREFWFDVTEKKQNGFEEAAKVATEYGNTEVSDEVAELLPTVSKRIALAKVNDAMKAKDINGVIAAYEEAVALDTTDANTALKFGQFLGNAKKYDEAVKYLEMAGRNGQEGNAKSLLSTTFLKNAADQLKAGKYADAVALAEKANNYKENAQAYLVAGQASQKSNKNADAITNFEKYLELAPTAKNANAIAFTVGALYQQGGNKAKALEFYKKVENDPQFGPQAKPLIASLSK